MARRRSSEDKLLLFLLIELPFYAVRLCLLLLEWTVEIAVWVFSVASELVASYSSERKNPLHQVLSWPGRRKDPLHVLVVWLLLIWLPVLYIYVNSDAKPPNQHSSASASVPLSNNIPSSAKNTERQTVNADRGKQRRTGTNSSSLAARPAKQDTRAASSIKPINEPKHTKSASKDQPTDTSTYLTMVQRRIISEWHPPSINEPMNVVVGFKLSRSGDILEVSIEQSSGNEHFDMAAKHAVLSANPLPMLPADVVEDEMTTRLRFSNES